MAKTTVTYTRLANDQWGVRVSGRVTLESGYEVRTTKHNGEKKDETLDSLISQTGDVQIWSIRRDAPAVDFVRPADVLAALPPDAGDTRARRLRQDDGRDDIERRLQVGL